ncbi:MAG TPA: nuclear transport factor 2 family protein [Candidatus Acidoferrum sp.]|nr:nuclear transport factor 2 family protein [Candidatus Acidoferrum sp.]
MNYQNYVELFNSGNDEALVKTYFTEDTVFSGGARAFHGAAELLKFLHWAHDGIREILRPQVVAQNKDHILAEIDIDFHALVDKPDFQFKPLKKGEMTTVKFFVVYYLRDGKVCHLKASTWPVEQGVSKPTPRLGGTLEQRQAFNEYTKAFSNADFDRFPQYYNDDVTCELGSGITLRGKDGILNFYREMFKTVRENLTIHRFVADENGIAADVTTQFTAIEDAPNFVVGPLKKGECIRGRVFVHYVLRDGKISKISVARAGEMSRSQPA